MSSVNVGATHKFVIVLNEKSPIGKLLSATGQLAMSLYCNATEEQRTNASFIPFFNPNGVGLFGKIEELNPLTKKFSLFK